MATQTASGSTQSGKFPRMSIVSFAGPTQVALDLVPPGPVTVGRRLGHDIQLADPASRDHALFVYSGELAPGHWSVIDTDSKHGTRLNGELLKPHTRYPIQHGDLIQITHWTLQVVDEGERNKDSSVVSVADDDHAMDATMISEVRSSHAAHPSQRHLALLLECAHQIHSAGNTASLAEAVLDAVVHGTGLPNAAFLKPITADGSVSVVAHRGAILTKQGRPNLSRSLIERASAGVPVRMNRSQHQMFAGASILELGIEEALCAPILLGGAVAGYIYLDSRQRDRDSSEISQEHAEYIVGLSQIAAMAMANLMRLDLKDRVAKIEADIAAAAEAQRWVLPTRQGVFGELSYLGESRPGRVVSGDFFDVIQLDRERLAVTLGDVSGKGVAASVLMTVAQGFLHAALKEHGDPGRAVFDLNNYVEPRCVTGRFLTLWAGVIDTSRDLLTYVDAGHGYAVLESGGMMRQLNEAGGLPIGIALASAYENAAVPFPSGSRMLVVSDGLIEQAGRDGHKAEEFGFTRVKDVLRGMDSASDPIAEIFNAIDLHAGGPLSDDATAVLVQRA
jgi:phosphoserine phosphatase RsbU/P